MILPILQNSNLLLVFEAKILCPFLTFPLPPAMSKKKTHPPILCKCTILTLSLEWNFANLFPQTDFLSVTNGVVSQMPSTLNGSPMIFQNQWFFSIESFPYLSKANLKYSCEKWCKCSLVIKATFLLSWIIKYQAVIKNEKKNMISSLPLLFDRYHTSPGKIYF